MFDQVQTFSSSNLHDEQCLIVYNTMLDEQCLIVSPGLYRLKNRHFFSVCARYKHAQMTQEIMCSKDAQWNSVESPYLLEIVLCISVSK